MMMEKSKVHLLLADDNEDDCYFFEQALQYFATPIGITAVNDGEQLMQKLHEVGKELPQILFLDLDMPRKNGFECLLEIKKNTKFKTIPVIILTASYENEKVNLLYDNGAHYYIRKPIEISSYNRIIKHAVTLIANSQLDELNMLKQPEKIDFILNVENILI